MFDKLAILRSFLQSLTWKKIQQIIVLIIVLSVTWATYENRFDIYNFVGKTRLSSHVLHTGPLTAKSSELITKAISLNNFVVAAQVQTIDFHKNTRSIIYSNITSRPLSEAYDQYKKAVISGDFPLFTGDATLNNRTINLINGEFVCFPFDSSAIAGIGDAAAPYIHTVCANGIPPTYGRFSGIIQLFLSRQPTLAETDQLRTISRELSLEIYENDFR